MNLSLPKKNAILTIIIMIILIAVGLKLFIYNQDGLIKIVDSNNISVVDSKVDENDQQNTIALAWQWKDTQSGQPVSSSTTNVDNNNNIFTEESVYKALSRVRLDENNNVIVDNETLTALNNTLDDDRLQLDSQALFELQLLIKKGLPGNAGEQVANIVSDYYQYLEAAREFNTVYENDSNAVLDINESIEQHKRNYQELSSLRQLYLDTDVATQLFSEYDANANYMFEILKVENDDNFSEEEKKKLSSEIALQHSSDSINVDNWNKRYEVFLVAKRNIITDSMNDNEKKTQLIELMNQHFSREELIQVSQFQLDKI